MSGRGILGVVLAVAALLVPDFAAGGQWEVERDENRVAIGAAAAESGGHFRLGVTCSEGRPLVVVVGNNNIRFRDGHITVIFDDGIPRDIVLNDMGVALVGAQQVRGAVIRNHRLSRYLFMHRLKELGSVRISVRLWEDWTASERFVLGRTARQAIGSLPCVLRAVPDVP